MKPVIVLVLAATACAPTELSGGDATAAVRCDASALSGWAGRAWTESMRAEALRLSGARAARVIRPGDAVTMDYREDRLNVHLTGEERIERLACG